MNIFSKIIFLLFIFISFSSHSRLATISEAPFEVEFDKIEITIEKDGSYIEKEEKQIKILNEAGRRDNGTTIITFVKDFYETEILEAKTLSQNGDVDVVDPQKIEIKPLASSEIGFDQKYQILISFPKLVIGSKIYLKTKTKFKPILENQFFSTFYFGYRIFQTNTSIKINSKIKDLDIKINNPNDVLEVKKSSNNDNLLIEINQKKPLYFSYVNEPFTYMLNPIIVPTVSISSISDYTKIGNSFLKEYERVINSKLPEFLNDIASKAKKINNENQQLDFITSSIAETIRYMGSWQTIKGKYYPRDLDVIVASGFADCKEYSVMVSAILRKIGYKSYAAFVERGLVYYQLSTSLPSMNDFNHAIIYTISPSGKQYWIDPTNVVSYSKGIFPDISGRPSLVLFEKKPEIKEIPNINYKNSVIDFTKEVIINGNKSVESGQIVIKGEKSIPLSGLEFFTSKEAITERFINELTDYGNATNSEIEIPPLNSRIVNDINIKFKFDRTLDSISTNLGDAIDVSGINEYWLNAFTTYLGDNTGIIFLDLPYTKVKKIIIKNIKINNLKHLNYSISTKWFDASRKCKIENNDIVIEQNIILKKSIITPDEINDDEFKKIKSEIKKNIYQTMIILQTS